MITGNRSTTTRFRVQNGNIRLPKQCLLKVKINPQRFVFTELMSIRVTYI